MIYSIGVYFIGIYSIRRLFHEGSHKPFFYMDLFYGGSSIGIDSYKESHKAVVYRDSIGLYSPRTCSIRIHSLGAPFYRDQFYWDLFYKGFDFMGI